MFEPSHFGSETARLRAMAAQSRKRAIESQLALGMTLCSVADNEIRFGRLEEVGKLLNKLRKAGETIRIHLNEPGHVPQTSIADLREQLNQLEKRTSEIALRCAGQKLTTLSRSL